MADKKETVVVFKDAKTREIHAFVDVDGHGARMPLGHFLDLVAEHYGSPFATVSKKGHLNSLRIAADKAIHIMKERTAAVAGRTGA